MKRIVFILVSLLCAIQLSAQTVIITGTVYDETGPVVGCQIYTSESRSTCADSSGYYSIPVSRDKTVEIQYECMGYKKVVLTYSPESGASFNPDVKMEEEEPEVVIILDEKPDKCIKCGGKVVPILYGLPSKKVMRALERGKYVWGGDVGDNYYENYACTSCRRSYHIKDKFVTVKAASIPDEVESITLYANAVTVNSQFGETEVLYPFDVQFEDKMGESINQEQGTRVRWNISGHPVESIRFEGFELISVEKKPLPDQGDMDTSAYCFKRKESKTQEN